MHEGWRCLSHVPGHHFCALLVSKRPACASEVGLADVQCCFNILSCFHGIKRQQFNPIQWAPCRWHQGDEHLHCGSTCIIDLCNNYKNAPPICRLKLVPVARLSSLLVGGPKDAEPPSSKPTPLTFISFLFRRGSRGGRSQNFKQEGRAEGGRNGASSGHPGRTGGNAIRAPTWAGANWHPMASVMSSGQLANGGTGVFIPAHLREQQLRQQQLQGGAPSLSGGSKRRARGGSGSMAGAWRIGSRG